MILPLVAVLARQSGMPCPLISHLDAAFRGRGVLPKEYS